MLTVANLIEGHVTMRGMRWSREVLVPWMFHIGALLHGQDPPGDTPLPADLDPVKDG
jgi:hypothetical protein